jgi:hypothetical protein
VRSRECESLEHRGMLLNKLFNLKQMQHALLAVSNMAHMRRVTSNGLTVSPPRLMTSFERPEMKR